jgi:hypothetical protein
MTVATGRVRVKSVALPTEHGGWGFVTEPLILGLLVAPTWPGLALGVAAFGVFLIQHPLLLTLKDWSKKKRYPRTPLAERFSLIYGGVTLFGVTIALLTSPHVFWPPILIALPLALIQLTAAVRSEARALLPEWAGALALGAAAPTIALAAGWEALPAFALWGILAARTLPSIVYVRARLRLERGTPAPILFAMLTALIGLGVVVALAATGLASPLTILGGLILLGRAALGLSPRRRTRRAQIIGFQEIGYGLLYVVLAATGR